MTNPRTRRTEAILAILLLTAALGCAGGAHPGRGWLGQQPRLYPNAHYRHVGVEAAEMDVARCLYEADVSVPPHAVARSAAVDTLTGAAGGAALGALAGAIAGDPGTGAAAGAAVGAAAGIGRAAVRASRPEAGYRGWTEACLRAKGYEVVSWQ